MRLQNVWQLSVMAKEIHQRPSKLLGIKAPYAAYCMDEAILVGGSLIQAEVEKVNHKNAKIQATRRDDKLRQLLGLPKLKRTRQFKQPPPLQK